MSARAVVLLVCVALVGCGEDDPTLDPADGLVACDPAEVECVRSLATALAAAHGIEWDPNIAIEVGEIPLVSHPRRPAPWWNAHLDDIETPFDSLDALAPVLPSPAGRAYLLGRDGLVFQLDPRVDGDDAAERHRLGLYIGLMRELRVRARPGHPVDIGSPWPTLHLSRYALQTGLAYIVEHAAQRGAAGLDPWAIQPDLLEDARARRAETAAPEAVATVALLEGHDGDPYRLLVERPALLARDCLPRLDGQDVECLGVERDGVDDFLGFEPRAAQSADGLLVEESFRAAGHPAADLADTIELHIGRTWHRFADGAAVRRDVYLTRSARDAEALAAVLAEGFDGIVERDGATVVQLATTAADIDLAAFAWGPSSFETFPLVPVGRVLAEGGERGGAPCTVEVPCDVRDAECQSCLLGYIEETLGEFGPRPHIVELTPDEAEVAYTGPLWADDRLRGRLDAEARFALGIERVRRESTDDATLARARRVAAWYEGTRRMVLIADDESERDLEFENQVFVHEATHAWQGDRHGLSARRAIAYDPGDGSEGHRVAVEGHAMLVEQLWLLDLDGRGHDDADWTGSSVQVADAMWARIGVEAEPAVDVSTLNRYWGGYALHARQFAATLDPTGGGRVADPWKTSAEVVARLRDAEVPPALDLARPGSEGDGLADVGLVTYTRRELYAWPFLLRLVPDAADGEGEEADFARGVAAADAVSGWVAGREATFTTLAGETAVWVEGQYVDEAAADRAEVVVERHVVALAERTGGVYRMVREGGMIRFAVAPTGDVLDTVWAGVE